MSVDETFMREAIKEAYVARAAGEFPCATVIVRDGNIIARNHSRDKELKEATAHSELLAVRDACAVVRGMELTDCTVYSTNEPCVMCASAIFHARVPRIVIGLMRSDLSHLMRQRRIGIMDLATDVSYKTEIVTGVLKNEALKVFENVTRS